jgi:hypothetical protein
MAGLRIHGVPRRTALVALALLALLLVQAAAQVHALRHLPGGPDGPALPGHHTQLCMDCVSHAPLLVLAGGLAAALFLAFRLISNPRQAAPAPSVESSRRHAFRSRAPPRCPALC